MMNDTAGSVCFRLSQSLFTSSESRCDDLSSGLFFCCKLYPPFGDEDIHVSVVASAWDGVKNKVGINYTELGLLIRAEESVIVSFSVSYAISLFVKYETWHETDRSRQIGEGFGTVGGLGDRVASLYKLIGRGYRFEHPFERYRSTCLYLSKQQISMGRQGACHGQLFHSEI